MARVLFCSAAHAQAHGHEFSVFDFVRDGPLHVLDLDGEEGLVLVPAQAVS